MLYFFPFLSESKFLELYINIYFGYLSFYTDKPLYTRLSFKIIFFCRCQRYEFHFSLAWKSIFVVFDVNFGKRLGYGSRLLYIQDPTPRSVQPNLESKPAEKSGIAGEKVIKHVFIELMKKFQSTVC